MHLHKALFCHSLSRTVGADHKSLAETRWSACAAVKDSTAAAAGMHTHPLPGRRGLCTCTWSGCRGAALPQYIWQFQTIYMAVHRSNMRFSIEIKTSKISEHTTYYVLIYSRKKDYTVLSLCLKYSHNIHINTLLNWTAFLFFFSGKWTVFFSVQIAKHCILWCHNLYMHFDFVHQKIKPVKKESTKKNLVL